MFPNLKGVVMFAPLGILFSLLSYFSVELSDETKFSTPVRFSLLVILMIESVLFFTV